MKRKGYISNEVATLQNFETAFYGFARGKHKRNQVRIFEENLVENLQALMNAYIHSSHQIAPYQSHKIYKPKYRIIHKACVNDHVIEWAAVLPVENWLMDTLYFRSPACGPGKGTHFFVRQEMEELRRCSQNEVYYYVQLDIHHYFAHIDHRLMKERYRAKIKDPVLLRFLDAFVDSYPQGLILGVKLSQLLSGLYLAPFDRLALRCFDIADDGDKFHYWQQKYVTDSFLTCRTFGQAAELAKGVAYLNAKFERFVRQGLKHYSRFADNIVIKHSDKTFLHLMTELAILTLTRDYLLQVNRSYNIRPTWMGNDLCDYVMYHDHIMLRKRNKKALCRQVARLRKRGLSQEQMQQRCASRVGFAQHADTKNLLRKLNMEKRLGTVIKNRKKKAPFDGMTADQKLSVEQLICFNDEDEMNKLIQLIDYQIDDSVIEKSDDDRPKRRIAIRYRPCRESSCR
ncbi:RNA-directed DNA polymerase (Reverse transcriptase) [gut metagenome]|uniref:RNA-directed DNA polymerase (Reverse transcriptase) n=1 Tax=gut metagenome TaxID=749906 RepID=J9FB93_9ZZZZ